jgi:DNA-binding response OmpR family regulator
VPETPFDLVLLDMRLSGGVEFCGHLRANPRMDLIPVLMLSPSATVEDEVAGIAQAPMNF